MVAVSQAPSPESNPNSPLPVTGTVGNYPTVNLIGGKFIQHRTENGAFATFACLNNGNCPKALVSVSANCTPQHPTEFYPCGLDGRKVFRTGISDSFRNRYPIGATQGRLRWVDNKPFNEPYTDLSLTRVL